MIFMLLSIAAVIFALGFDRGRSNGRRTAARCSQQQLDRVFRNGLDRGREEHAQAVQDAFAHGLLLGAMARSKRPKMDPIFVAPREDLALGNHNQKEAVRCMPIWEDSFIGRTWQQMPGQGPDDKKMNFALFRRGKLSLVDVEKWEEGETSSQRASRKYAVTMVAARRVKLALARARSLEEAESQLPIGVRYAPEETTSPPPPAMPAIENELSPESDGHENQSHEETHEMKGEISPRQRDLFRRFDDLCAQKPTGFKSRFCKRAIVRGYAAQTFFKGGALRDDILDRIAEALDDESWQNGATVRKQRAGTATKVSKRSVRVNGTPPRAPRRASGQVTLEDLKLAMAEHEAA